MMSLPTAAAQSRRRPAVVLLALWLMLSVLLAWAWQRGRPVALPAAHNAAAASPPQGALLPCVSYAPFRKPGQSPFDPTLIITPAEIEADLRLLRSVTDCVRTYGLEHGLDAVPAVAKRLGMRVVLGAWIGRDPLENAAQLQLALALCKSHADVITMLVVGNEVLLRREQTPQALAALLKQAQQATTVPIAYADVWEFWQRHAPYLLEHVDVVAAHILPYWEDEPVAVQDAAQHVFTIAEQLRLEFAPKPIFVAETGWPAVGRQRGPSVPGAVEQARFLRELVSMQAKQPPQTTPTLRFNVIEGFDQPWKRDLEGAMGGFWGMFTADGHQRLTLSGPVVADLAWWRVPVGAAVGAVLMVVVTAATRRRPPWAGKARHALLLIGAIVGATLPVQVHWLMDWNRNAVEWISSGVATVLMLACSWAAAWALARGLQDGATGVPQAGVHANFTAPKPSVNKELTAEGKPRWMAAAHGALLFLVACGALGLFFDARYRPLTAPLLLVPAALGLLLHALGERWSTGAREERLLAWCLVVAAPLMLLQEGLVNHQAWGMAALWLALALPLLRVHHTPNDASVDDAALRGRTSTKAANNTAGALKPAE